ncbi:MAG: hypothetical protein WC006_02690 [Bacilli bacterium]|nr:hypothetical protein [Bacilli bacterium]
MEKLNRVYIFKYFYALIMFLGILMLPFLLLSFQNEYEEVLEEYNDAVTFALSEEFVLTKEEKDIILDLHNQVKKVHIAKQYKTFNAFMIIVIFLILFNYLYIQFGLKYKILENNANLVLNKRLLLITTIVEILYFVLLLVFSSGEYIGINFWTLFFINIIVVIFVVVLALQIQYLLKPKTKES